MSALNRFQRCRVRYRVQVFSFQNYPQPSSKQTQGGDIKMDSADSPVWVMRGHRGAGGIHTTGVRERLLVLCGLLLAKPVSGGGDDLPYVVLLPDHRLHLLALLIHSKEVALPHLAKVNHHQDLSFCLQVGSCSWGISVFQPKVSICWWIHDTSRRPEGLQWKMTLLPIK